ncbi:HAMP domain-containing histidine kinase [Bacillus sp. NP157]|nr:HAMP domain-containing histidine kinase [Bacillus sp. NP157]
MLIAFLVLGFRIHDENVSYIEPDVLDAVDQSLTQDSDGRIALHPTAVLRQAMQDHPGLWIAVRDERGHALDYGTPPPALAPLIARLDQFAASDIHGTHAPYADTTGIRVLPRPNGKLHAATGGAGVASVQGIATMVADYLTWRLLVPTVICTLILVPIVVRRSMKGVRSVARHADAIDVEKRGARLADQAVPHEIQPLVRGFNAALSRVTEGYEVRDRFLASAAHELRAPIAILRTRIDAMDPGPERSRLMGDVARLWNLAEQLLDLQRFSGDSAVLTRLDLGKLSADAVADIAPLALESGNDIEFDAPRDPVWIQGDALALCRVLMNLIQNAMVHASGNGTISVEVRADGQLRVSDQGSGIAPEERARIFEPFYRTRPSSSGTGLGLHLARQVVERHGGSIDVTDGDGGGACFRVRLPLAKA